MRDMSYILSAIIAAQIFCLSLGTSRIALFIIRPRHDIDRYYVYVHFLLSLQFQYTITAAELAQGSKKTVWSYPARFNTPASFTLAIIILYIFFLIFTQREIK